MKNLHNVFAIVAAGGAVLTLITITGIAALPVSDEKVSRDMKKVPLVLGALAAVGLAGALLTKKHAA
jgi:hypothetical protein